MTYDSVGNPLQWKGNVLQWNRGRRLIGYGSNGYTYDSGGIRQSKTVNGITHTYCNIKNTDSDFGMMFCVEFLMHGKGNKIYLAVSIIFALLAAIAIVGIFISPLMPDAVRTSIPTKDNTVEFSATVTDILCLSDDGKNPVLIQTEQYGNKLILSETDYADMNKLNLLAPGDIILFSVYDVDVDALTNSDSVMNVEVISLSCDGYDILSMSSIAHDREILLQENIRNSRILFITEALCFMLAAILLYHKYRKSRKCSANSESNDTADGIK